MRAGPAVGGEGAGAGDDGASRSVDRVIGVYLLVVSAFLLFGLHLPGLPALWRGDPTVEYLTYPGLFWLVKVMDLGIAVPVIVIAALRLIRSPERAVLLRYAVTGWAALLASSVAGMAVVMQVTGDPAASRVLPIAFSGFAFLALVLAVLAHRPLLSPGAAVPAEPDGHSRRAP